MMGAFGVIENSNHVFTKDNKVIFSAKEQGYYDALAYLNDLYKEGLIDKDVFTLSDDQYAARDSSGNKVGMLAGYNPDSCGTTDTSSFRVLPLLKNASGDRMVGINNVTKTGGFVISKNCKNPAALVRWYDYINSTLEQALLWGRGERGVWWDIVEKDGKEVPMFLTMDARCWRSTAATRQRLSTGMRKASPALPRPCGETNMTLNLFTMTNGREI